MSFFVYVCFPLFVAAFSFILSQSLLSPFYHSLQVISSLYSSFVLVLSFSLPRLFFLHPVPAYISLNSLFHTASFSVHFKLSLSFLLSLYFRPTATKHISSQQQFSSRTILLWEKSNCMHIVFAENKTAGPYSPLCFVSWQKMTLDNFKRMSFSRQGDTLPFCYAVLLPTSLVIPTNIVRLFKERRKKEIKVCTQGKKISVRGHLQGARSITQVNS